MVSRSPKTPNREFTIKFKNKSVKVVVSTQKVNGFEMWGGQFFCPWYCGKHISADVKTNPKRVVEQLKEDLKYHWENKHKY